VVNGGLTIADGGQRRHGRTKAAPVMPAAA
jgi:hypothetical protein